jgi:hypothetical protein
MRIVFDAIRTHEPIGIGRLTAITALPSEEVTAHVVRLMDLHVIGPFAPSPSQYVVTSNAKQTLENRNRKDIETHGRT